MGKIVKSPAQQFEEIAEEQKAGIEYADLGDLSEAVADMQMHIEKATDLQKLLDEHNDCIRQLSEKSIPELMQALGLEKVITVEGHSVTIKPFYSAKISEENKIEAFDWLKEQGDDSIIKSKVDCSFGKGEEETVQEEELVGWLVDNGYAYNQKRGVHPQTLKAYVRGRIEGGEELPRDLFGVYIGHKTEIK